jgi:hypothetical protein
VRRLAESRAAPELVERHEIFHGMPSSSDACDMLKLPSVGAAFGKEAAEASKEGMQEIGAGRTDVGKAVGVAVGLTNMGTAWTLA